MTVLSKTLFAAVLVAVSATASNAACNVNARQLNQEARILTGVVNGNVSLSELLRLGRGYNQVRRVERYYRQTGGIGPAECAALNAMLNAESKRIYRKKHN
jgi:hypothetical protein